MTKHSNGQQVLDVEPEPIQQSSEAGTRLFCIDCLHPATHDCLVQQHECTTVEEAT